MIAVKHVTKRLAKAQAFFQRNVCEFVESIGVAAKPCDFAREYNLQTNTGQLEITVFDNWIACRFADPYTATVFSRQCGPTTNPRTGKWNFVYADDPDVLNNGLVIGNFVSAVKRLLAYMPTPADVAEAERLKLAVNRKQ